MPDFVYLCSWNIATDKKGAILQVQFARELMEGLGLATYRPTEGAQPLQPDPVDPALKAYRRKRQLAHRTARRQRMVNRAKGKAYRYG